MYKSKYYKEKHAGKSNSITSFGITIALFLMGVVALLMGIFALSDYVCKNAPIWEMHNHMKAEGYLYDSKSGTFYKKPDDQTQR